MLAQYYALTYNLKLIDLGLCKDFSEADDIASNKIKDLPNDEILYILNRHSLLALNEEITSQLI